ncbi:MAG: peptidylprolyl isomerase [Chloroflexi bacterium]|nr:peptidylprolyl isomerase [Chloroflexota bacterium]
MTPLGKTFLLTLLSLLITACGNNVPLSQVETPAIASAIKASPTAPLPTCLLLKIPTGPGTPRPSDAVPILEGDHVFGPANAAVTLVIYSDFQCRNCALVAASLNELLAAHPDDLRLVYRHLPLSGEHNKAVIAAQAAEAADLQGMFWQMHDFLFARQGDWSALTVEAFEAWARQQAAALGMDGERFQADLMSEAVKASVAQAVIFAAGLPAPVLPILLINGQPYRGLADFDSLDQTVRLYALIERQFSACPPLTIDPLKQYLATLHTARGEVVIQLYADKAPFTVNNFVFLARQSWYDGITFHRVLPGFIAQSGDPSGTGMGNPGYLFGDEFDPSLRFAKPGVVAMANAGPATNGSQFFITFGPAPHLEGGYTIFGQVIRGMEVLAALTARDLLFNVTIEEK